MAYRDVLARKKEFAEFFAQRSRRLVGPVVVFTRTPEGRKLLLRARNHSLSGAFEKHPERVSCWKSSYLGPWLFGTSQPRK